MPFADITGQAPRVLAGVVDDPLFGSVTATGYIDFDTGFDGTAPALVGAAVRLRRTYVYGDTMSMVTLAVHDILEQWDPTGVKADSALVLGPEIITHTFLSTDSVVLIPMPTAWVSMYEDTLRSSGVDSLFHGLAFAPVDGQSVVGFINSGTVLEVYSADDTTAFNFQRSLTTTTRMTEPMLPEARAAMQDGTGPGVRVTFDLDSLATQPINGAAFLIHADTVAFQDTPMDFVRPMVEELQLVAVRNEDDPALLVGQTRITDEGIFSFSGSEMATFFYRILFGLEEYEYLELRVPVLDNTLNGLLLHDVDSPDAPPELRLILSS